VQHLNVFADFVGKLLKFQFPQSISVAFAAAAVRCQDNFSRIALFSKPLGLPPLPDGLRSEDSGV
jgi:hypothetical protein